MSVDHEALEKQVLATHAAMRLHGVEPVPDCDVYYLVRSLYFTDNVLVIPMRFPIDRVVVPASCDEVWYQSDYEAILPESYFHILSPEVPGLPSAYSLEAQSYRLHGRTEDKTRLNNLSIGTQSRHIGVAATATGKDTTVRIIVFAPYCWVWTPMTTSGWGVVFRCGIQAVGTKLYDPFEGVTKADMEEGS